MLIMASSITKRRCNRSICRNSKKKTIDERSISKHFDDAVKQDTLDTKIWLITFALAKIYWKIAASNKNINSLIILFDKLEQLIWNPK